jgi:hypothetical protein
MPNADSKTYEQVKRGLQEAGILEGESDVQHGTKFSCRSGIQKAAIIVFSTGRLHVEGSESELKGWLGKLKTSIETGTSLPGLLLPAEIEKLPQTLKERVPACDGVVIWFFQEALKCYKAGSVAGAGLMLGAASEKAVFLLIECYAAAIADETNRDKFLSRVNNRMISVKYEEFKKSYKGAKPKPTDAILGQDLEQLIEGAFNFYRFTRNQVGHPQIIPDLDKGVILANIGQFVTYMERIHGLMAFFQKTAMKV